MFSAGDDIEQKFIQIVYRSGVQKRAFFLTIPGKPIHNAASC